MLNKHRSVWDSNNPISAETLEKSRPAWRKALLNGDSDGVAQMVAAGIPVDFPIDAQGRSPLVDLALLQPNNPAQEQALTETARLLINSGAALSLSDYKGLVPADYALVSPNPLMAREIVLSTLRHGVHAGLAHPFRPNLDTLFALTVVQKDRIAMQDHFADNLHEIQQALKLSNRQNDPILMEAGAATVDFWKTLRPVEHKAMPNPSSALRQQFRRVAVMALPEDEREKGDHYSPEEIADAHDQYRFLEWRHAQNFRPLP